MVVKTNQFFGLDLNKTNEVYYIAKPVCDRTIFIHPDLIERENGKIEFPEKPITNCDVIEINYFKTLMVVPGSYKLFLFDTNGGDIEGIFGCVKRYIEEDYDHNYIRAMILADNYEDVRIEWSDRECNKMLTIIEPSGKVTTIPNPEPVEASEDEDY